MKQSKNIISDWLDKHGDPEIDKLVEQQAREIMARYNIEYQYLDLLQDVLDNGVEKKDRTGTGTISVFGRQIRHKMSEGFPLLTTKKMAFKTMVTELLWFLRNDTNIKYLIDNGCNIWNGDAYKNWKTKYKEVYDGLNDWQKEQWKELTEEEFINAIKTDDEFAKKWGELGPIYGKQWRSWETRKLMSRNDVVGEPQCLPKYFETKEPVDQIQNLINDLKTNPDSRRLMVNAWNVGELDKMVLPPCHFSWQCYSYEKEGKRYLSLAWNQRSVDTFLGLPFNIASYGLLLEMIANEVNMIPDELIGNLGDVHLYKNHIEQAKEQITRQPYELPQLEELPNYLCMKDDWECYKPEDIKIKNYQSHPAIKADLSN